MLPVTPRGQARLASVETNNSDTRQLHHETQACITKHSNSSVRNYRSPSRHWRLTFRVGDNQLATWSPKIKKKRQKKEKEKSSSRESFAKKAGRSAHAFSPRRHASSPADREQVLSTRALTCKIDNKETPCPNTQLESRFTFLTLPLDVAKEGALIQSGHSSFPVRSRTRHETLTCHVHARCYSAVFSATSLSTRVVERTKRHIRGHLKISHIADKRKNFHMGGRGFRPDSLCDRQ